MSYKRKQVKDTYKEASEFLSKLPTISPNGLDVEIRRRFFRGNNYLDVRKWYTDPVTGTRKPTNKGLTLLEGDWIVIVDMLKKEFGKHATRY